MICESGVPRGCSRGFDARQPSREPQVSKSVSGACVPAAKIHIAGTQVPDTESLFLFSFFFFKEFSMRITRFVATTLLVFMIVLPVVPAMASSDWVDDFLRRYQPSLAADPASGARLQPVGQLF